MNRASTEAEREFGRGGNGLNPSKKSPKTRHYHTIFLNTIHSMIVSMSLVLLNVQRQPHAPVPDTSCNKQATKYVAKRTLSIFRRTKTYLVRSITVKTQNNNNNSYAKKKTQQQKTPPPPLNKAHGPQLEKKQPTMIITNTVCTVRHATSIHRCCTALYVLLPYPCFSVAHHDRCMNKHHTGPAQFARELIAKLRLSSSPARPAEDTPQRSRW